MSKTKLSKLPPWIRNLRALMEKRGSNPRSLSLQAGLNATAVRDMLDGRSRFPRYDTIQALAAALETTPALLMGDEGLLNEVATAGFAKDLELLTEVLTHLQAVTRERDRKLSPRDFATMTTALYKRIQSGGERKKKPGSLRPQIHDLLDYELLRKKRASR